MDIYETFRIKKKQSKLQYKAWHIESISLELQ